MCDDSWISLIRNCLDDPPFWLDIWANVVFVYWLLFLGVIGVAWFRLLQLIFQDEVGHLSLGHARGKMFNDGWTRLFTDYKWYIFLALNIGSVLLWWGFGNVRSPKDVLRAMGVVEGVWNLAPIGVEYLVFYARLAFVTTIIWIVIALVGLVVLWIDPAGSRKFVLELVEGELKWWVWDSSKLEYKKTPLEVRDKLVVRSETEIWFHTKGDIVVTRGSPQGISVEKDYSLSHETGDAMSSPKEESVDKEDPLSHETDDAMSSPKKESADFEWIQVTFYASERSPTKTKARLEGQGKLNTVKSFEVGGIDNVNVEIGDTFHVGKQSTKLKFH